MVLNIGCCGYMATKELQVLSASASNSASQGATGSGEWAQSIRVLSMPVCLLVKARSLAIIGANFDGAFCNELAFILPEPKPSPAALGGSWPLEPVPMISYLRLQGLRNHSLVVSWSWHVSKQLSVLATALKASRRSRGFASRQALGQCGHSLRSTTLRTFAAHVILRFFRVGSAGKLRDLRCAGRKELIGDVEN